MDIEKIDKIEEDTSLVSNENDKEEIFIRNRIEENLKKFDMPELERLKPEIIDYLIKIESTVIDMENERESYVSKYKATKVNIKSIGDRTGMSRTTIYKYKDILPKYIKHIQCEFNENSLIKDLDLENQTINELKEEIRKLQFKSLKEQKLLDKIEIQQKEYNNLINQVANLKSENSSLYSEIEKLRSKKIGKISNIFY